MNNHCQLHRHSGSSSSTILPVTSAHCASHFIARNCGSLSSYFICFIWLSFISIFQIYSQLLIDIITMQRHMGIIVVVVILIMCPEIHGRRGKTRVKSKSRLQIGLPITGKYRDPESDQYYNNNNGAKILLASHFDLEYVLGHKIAFLCVARGSPRPHITWFKDGAEIYTHLYLHVHEWQVSNDTVKSKLEIDPATQMDAGVYECTADNMYAIDRRSFKTDFSIAFD